MTTFGRRTGAAITVAAIAATTMFAATPAMAYGPGDIPGGPGGGPGGGTGIMWMSQPDAVGDLTVGDSVDVQLMAMNAVSYAAADASVEDLGLNVDGTGHLTGTVADAPGAYAFTVTASDGAEGTSDQTFTGTITKVVPPDYHPVWISLTAPSGTVGSPYNFQLEATQWGGAMSIDPINGGFDFPPGFTLDVERSSIHGTPTRAGDYTFTLVAIGPDEVSRSPHTFTIHVNPAAPAITTTQLPSFTAGESVNFTFGTDRTGDFRWSVIEGSLPAGVHLNSATGALTGTPTKSGDFVFAVKVVDGFGQNIKSFNGTVASGEAAPTITSTATHFDFKVGKAFTYTFAADQDVEWSHSAGVLPIGLHFNYNTGVLSGTPTAVESYTFSVSAENANGIDTVTFTGSVAAAGPRITSGALPELLEGKAFSFQLTADQQVNWKISGGGLPDGVTFNATTGIISGTPTKKGQVFTAFIVAQNGNGYDEVQLTGAVMYPVEEYSVNDDGSISIRIRLIGLFPYTVIHMVLHSDPIDLGEFTADENGVIDVTVRIPASAPAGDHHIVYVDENGNEVTVASLTIPADRNPAIPADGNPVIPALGFESAPFAMFAAVLMLAGMVLTVVRRRKVNAE